VQELFLFKALDGIFSPAGDACFSSAFEPVTFACLFFRYTKATLFIDLPGAEGFDFRFLGSRKTPGFR
jgi:hypothetical protein